jgi:hypothetical protein
MLCKFQSKPAGIALYVKKLFSGDYWSACMAFPATLVLGVSIVINLHTNLTLLAARMPLECHANATRTGFGSFSPGLGVL